MKDNHEEILVETLFNVFEQQTFMFCEPADKSELPDNGDTYVGARIDVLGDTGRGYLVVVIPKSLCVEVAANVLGIDEDDEDAVDKGLDAFKELVNVACGQLLTRVAGEKPVFNLSVPREKVLAGAEWLAVRDDAGAVAFLVDESPVVAKFVFEERA